MPRHMENDYLILLLAVESRPKKLVVKLEAMGRICVHFLHMVQKCDKKFCLYVSMLML